MSIDIGSRRELFVDHFLIGRLDGAALAMHEPRDEGIVLRYDRPWENVYAIGGAAIKFGDEFRIYYRGMPPVQDGHADECTCLAVSSDGCEWAKPNLGQFELHGTRDNNAILAHQTPFSHNFMPFLDTRPGVPADEQFKAVAGIHKTDLCLFASGDGIEWRRLGDKPGITSEAFAFDSPNLAFWSEAEGQYVCYFRTWKNKLRWISRATSDDFRNWGSTEEMVFRHGDGLATPEHLYTNGTHPYLRAPHIYVALPRRFMEGRTVLSDEEADKLGVSPAQRSACSDAVFMTSRGGNVYDRTFMEAFMRPGEDRCNWSSRPGTIAANVVQTGPREMSLYRNGHYGAPTNHMRRYSLRLDGFVSVQAPYAGGEMVTKPFTFDGSQLTLNFDTSAAGGMRVEVQDEHGAAIPGFSLDESVELVGDEIDRVVSWNSGSGVSQLAGQPVRLRLQMKDADVYSLRFC